MYKYEDEIKEELDFISFESLGNQNEMLKELDDVYKKSKAWDSLKEGLMEEYPEVLHLADVSNGDDERGQMNKHEEILEHMDKLDGTNGFRDLRNDLEDK